MWDVTRCRRFCRQLGEVPACPLFSIFPVFCFQSYFFVGLSMLPPAQVDYMVVYVRTCSVDFNAGEFDEEEHEGGERGLEDALLTVMVRKRRRIITRLLGIAYQPFLPSLPLCFIEETPLPLSFRVFVLPSVVGRHRFLEVSVQARERKTLPHT